METGVKRIRVHDIRHSHVSYLINLGFSPVDIAARMGHESPTVTMNTYAHLYPRKQQEMARMMDQERRRNDDE
jgi:integrase